MSIELRTRPEPRRECRRVGAINDASDVLGDMSGWLVIADLGDPAQSVLELRTLPNESAREAADRLARAGQMPALPATSPRLTT
jgi:hypothetical protein